MEWFVSQIFARTKRQQTENLPKTNCLCQMSEEEAYQALIQQEMPPQKRMVLGYRYKKLSAKARQMASSRLLRKRQQKKPWPKKLPASY